MTPIVVLGTGFAAAGAVHRLTEAGLPMQVFDREDHIGGHTATHELAGSFVFDDGPHVSFTKDERIQQLLADNVGGAYETVQILLDNHWRGHRFRHPAQLNLHGLPTDLVVSILTELAEIKEPPAAVSDYREWCLASFGPTFAETFPLTYARKYHTVDAASLTTDWLGPRMYRPSLAEAIRGAIDPTPQTAQHYVTHFRYPTHGGYVAYLRPWFERVRPELGHDLSGVDPVGRRVRFANGVESAYERLVSSVPLPELIPRIDGAPADVVAAAARLSFTRVVLVNLAVDRADLSEAHITYVYDDDILFSRISFPRQLSPETVPPGAGAIQAEVYFSDRYRPLTVAPETLIEPVIAGLRRMGTLREDDVVLASEACLVRYGNVIYDHDRGPAAKLIHDFLDEVGIHYCGRYGDWNHEWTDEAFLSGEAAAQAAIDRLPG